MHNIVVLICYTLSGGGKPKDAVARLKEEIDARMFEKGWVRETAVTISMDREKFESVMNAFHACEIAVSI